MLPGSGALECDIGGMQDIISKRRGSLLSGLVEVQMMIRLNPSVQTLNIMEIEQLEIGSSSNDGWKKFIPKRPKMPEHYFAEDDEDDDREVEAPGPRTPTEVAATAPSHDNSDDSDSDLDIYS